LRAVKDTIDAQERSVQNTLGNKDAVSALEALPLIVTPEKDVGKNGTEKVAR